MFFDDPNASKRTEERENASKVRSSKNNTRSSTFEISIFEDLISHLPELISDRIRLRVRNMLE